MNSFKCPVCHGDIEISDTTLSELDNIMDEVTRIKIETTIKHPTFIISGCAEFLQELFKEQQNILTQWADRMKNMANNETPTERKSHVQTPFPPDVPRQDS